MLSLRARIYAYWGADAGPPIDSLYGLYFLHIGQVGLPQIAQLFVIWWLVRLFAEPLTGLLADRYGDRSRLLLAAQLLRASCFAIWLAAPTMVGFALGFVLRGLGGSLSSGTIESLIYDELTVADQQAHYTHVLGRCHQTDLICRMSAKLVASAALLWLGGYPTVLWMSIGTALTAAGFGWSLPAARHIARAGLTVGDIQQVIRREVARQPFVIYCVLFAGCAVGLFEAIGEFRGLFLQSFGVSVGLVPLLLIVVDLPALIAIPYAKHLKSWADGRSLLALASLAPALVLAGLYGGFFGAACLALMSVVTRCLSVIYDAKLHDHISATARATIASAKGSCVLAVGLVLFLLYDPLAGLGNMLARGGALVGFGGVTLLMAGGLWCILPRSAATS